MINNKERVKAAVAYIVKSFADELDKLGSVKLNKILWFADVETLKMHNETITGESVYIARDFGPALPNITQVIQDLHNEGIINSSRLSYEEYTQWRYEIKDKKKVIALCEKIASHHKKMLAKWCNEAKTRTVREIVKIAHSYDWWDDIAIADNIPINLGVEYVEEIQDLWDRTPKR